MRLMVLAIAVGLFGLTLVGGCGGYATPADTVDRPSSGNEQQAPPQTQPADTHGAAPLAQLPTAIAVVRVRGTVNDSSDCSNENGARLSVMDVRDVEKTEQIDRLGKLPMVKGLVPISPIMVPQDATWRDLHAAAADLHADMLLVYSLSSQADLKDALVPLSVATLGLSPNESAEVRCTATAVLLDTRNGYVYGTMEASDQFKQPASAWTSCSAMDLARTKAEEGAFDKLTQQMEATWPNVVKELQRAK